MCPLCRVVHKLDREYIWYFFDEYSTQDETLDALRRSRGLCFEHADALRRLEVDGFHSTLGLSTTYLDTVKGLAEELANLTASDDFGAAPCPACAYRDEGVETNARYLLEEIGSSPASRERFVQGPGLCFRHFGLVWRIADADQRNLLAKVERHTLDGLVTDLSEHIRKQGAEHKDDPEGGEADAWLRALRITAGWPPPDAPLGEPEGGA
jgi:hypothetical protein